MSRAAIAGALLAGCGSERPGEPDAGTPGAVAQGIGINGPGGWLDGTALAGGITGTAVPLVDAAIHAQNVLTMVNTPAVPTDFYGGFKIGVANGNYKLCWSKPGYTSGCTTTVFNINNRSRSVGSILLPVALPRKVRGTALLSDGSACLAVDRFIGTEFAATGELVNASNVVVHATRLNFRGEWVFPDPGQGHKVRVKCGSIVQEAATANMSPTVPHKFVFNNGRPVIRPVSATAGGQEATKGVAPGTTVQLSTSAGDPDSDALTYRWRATLGTLPNTGTLNATWTLPSLPGTYTAYISANDGKGGYTTRAVRVRVRTDPNVLFSGNVRDNFGNVLPGASVAIGTTTATTDNAGHFSVTVPEADSYLLNISKMGYAEFSQPTRLPATGQKYALIKATAKPINPAVDNVIVDERREWLDPCQPQASCRRTPGRVTIPANSLKLEPPPVGGLTAYLVTYDVNSEGIPGDQEAINSAGERVALASYGALFIEVRDTSGTKYNLAPGKTARVEIPFQSAIAEEQPPTTMDMWKYHPDTGKWSERTGVGTRSGDYYTINVPNFSTQNADIEKTNPSCLYVDLEDGILDAAYDLEMRLQVPVSAGGAVRVYNKKLDEPRNVVYNLPTNLPYTLEIFENLGGKKVLKIPLTGLTGSAWGSVGNPGLAEPDCAVATVKLSDAAGSAAFTKFLSIKGTGSEAEADAYYAAINPDPATARTTLGAFWAQNGFDVTGGALDQVRTTFINFNDLGFGRDMHCRKDPVTNNVACYVTNYGVGDQAPGNYDLAKTADTSTAGATVAMEYSPGPLGNKIVKFYVFGGGVAASPRVGFADLDGSGQKFVPQLCLTCHGGNYQPSDPVDPAEVNMGSSFREFDIYSYRDGTLGDKPNELASGIHEIVNLDPLDPPLGQQAEFLEQNKIVRATAPQAAITNLINIWYHNTDTLPFDQNAVPTGWNIDASTSDLYLKVVAKACRTCHLAQPSLDANSKAWATFDQFRTYRNNNFIPGAVCYGDPSHGASGFADEKRFRYMPHSNVTYKNFWLDTTAYTTLGNYVGPGWGTPINASADHECIP